MKETREEWIARVRAELGFTATEEEWILANRYSSSLYAPRQQTFCLMSGYSYEEWKLGEFLAEIKESTKDIPEDQVLVRLTGEEGSARIAFEHIRTETMKEHRARVEEALKWAHEQMFKEFQQYQALRAKYEVPPQSLGDDMGDEVEVRGDE